ncbi:hypothetical protein GALMADRAFT_139523 [Galerina marginata CBS 339.88]|uniref:Retrotransposon Copia-like N-terminal domain-containing protein n=1 Tax=Galerina marginata (strain CBS 339.88) TaxID=685588 RepID=A0A067T9N4_GALM3|nr:hypothetical protein GALMADRAFT_139523 [Galerina marginata CBS 339.88]
MGKHDIYKLSETPTANYDAWEFRTRISATSKGLLVTILGTDYEPSTSGCNSKVWKAWKARQEAAAELLVKALDDDQLIHIRGLDSDPALMWERLRTVHEKTGVTGSASDLWNRFHTATYSIKFRFELRFWTELRHHYYSDPTIPLRTHVSTIRFYAEALERLHSDKPSDTQIISRIFTSLPSFYSTIIKILKIHNNADDLDFIVESILAEETTQKSTTNLSMTAGASNSIQALMTTHTPSQSLVCETPACKAKGRTGHLTENCFWPGGAKEGQWPDWWFKLKGIQLVEEKPSAMTAISHAYAL